MKGARAVAAGLQVLLAVSCLLAAAGSSGRYTVGAPLALGHLMGLLSAKDVLNWYPHLNKPRWTIPTPLFGPALGLLYSLMGYASCRVFQKGGGALPLGLYAAPLALNLGWQPLFFVAKNFSWAKRDLLALLGVLGATIWQFGQVDTAAAQLMLPYLAFCCYATALTYSISGMNPGEDRGRR